MRFYHNTLSVLASTLLLAITGCSNNKAIIEEQATLLEEKERVIAEQEISINQLNDALRRCTNNLAKTRAQCDQKLTQLETKDQQLLERERELRQQLAEDIAAKNVEIDKLRGYLSVKVMDKVLFRSGKTDILPEGAAILTRIAASVENSDENIHVEGHTDDVPIGALLVAQIPTNWELSVLRAAQVVRFLESNNIDPVRMAAIGHSEFKPVAGNTDDENRQLNRRVEIVLIPAQSIAE